VPEATNRTTTSAPAPAHSHHGSHLALLTSVADHRPGSSTVDAIIVPTARATTQLGNAIELAAELDCPVVALCSHQASAREAVRLAEHHRVELVAIDTDKAPDDLLPDFTTNKLLNTNGIEYNSDTSTKRNVGLLLANLMGWRRIVFLDDDIRVPDPGDLGRAAFLLNDHAAVGLWIEQFPDNSVVCHAYRASGATGQKSFIGAGALAVGAKSMSSFFPSIYNEDWLFLLDDDRLVPTTATGSAIQSRYNPYERQDRARDEEFGDCLAEGVYWLLDRGLRVRDADPDYWLNFLGLRRTFINEVIERITLTRLSPHDKQQMLAALDAALERSEQIKHELYADYLHEWRKDRELWRGHVIERRQEYRAGLTRLDQFATPDTAKVLSELGLMECSHLTRT
jgi:glycosyltransferase involved in cell wall biosynthesis